MDARATYEAGKARAMAQLALTESRIRALSTARLVVAGFVIAGICGLVWWHMPRVSVFGLGVLVAVFASLVVEHSRAFASRGRAEAGVRFNTRGLARLDGTWRAFRQTDASYGAAGHPYAADLDLFGEASVFQLLNATETPFGRDALSRALASGTIAETSRQGEVWEASLRADQEAVLELASKVGYREALSVEGAVLATETPDPAPFLRWSSHGARLHVPPLAMTAAYLLPPLVVVAFFAAPALQLPKLTWLLVVVAERVLASRFAAATLSTLEVASSGQAEFARYGAIFAAAVSEKHAAPRLVRALSPLHDGAGGAGVVTEMARLQRIVGFADARRNDVFRLIIGPLLLWDLHCAVRLAAWRQRSGAKVPSWFAALAELEAFASLAGFAFDRPDHVMPEPRGEPLLHATGLGHPLIDGKRRVGNDVDLPRAGTALVVTGSNMSGKSTLLRAIGVNLVLARLGAPVAARSFAFGDVQLATSMRVSDSLEGGVSHFYAELQKLKRVVDLANAGTHVMFLLDEILHGTNSRERIIGARAIVTGLLERGAMGAVSTHDLGIADLAIALPDAVKNLHFEEQVHADGTMTFDYQLRPGTVQSSNALRLMRAIGLDVPITDAAPDARPAPVVPFEA